MLKKIKEAQQKGFIVRLIFLWINSEELCDFRVRNRVSLGGHNILSKDIMRRYKRGFLNFSQYFQSVDECSIYFSNENPILLSYKDKFRKIVIIDQELHEMFQETHESILMD